MAPSEQPRRRFAPVPIETTFQSVRKGPQPQQGIGPNAELTPEASPRSPPTQLAAPEPRVRRRFAPQLIETSRRARRVGDAGPATRPTDKTDITPYTKHIYLSKSKGRRRWDGTVDDEPPRHMPPTRRETEDEAVKEYLLELAAKEVERQIQEAALAAFPNSRAREGGVAHFYFRESSDSDGSPESASPNQNQARVRRKSSSLDLGWWHKHMQDHAEILAHERGRDDVIMNDDDPVMRSDSDLDMMALSAPPDPLWTTTRKVGPEDRRDSMAGPQGVGVELRVAQTKDNAYTVAQARERSNESESPRSQGETIPADPVKTTSGMPSASLQSRPETAPSPFSRPFGALHSLKSEDPKLQQMRKAASPPMLGKELTFRTCPSPQQTKLEPDHLFKKQHCEEKHRDVSGDGGLWRGYCFRSESTEEYLVPAELHPVPMIATPYPPASPGDPCLGSQSISDELSSFLSSNFSDSVTGLSVGHRAKNGNAKGLHMLHGLDERLRREKAKAERHEKISQEFDDEFVTQVYNYLSLGYPAMARSFDEELSKISRISIFELGGHDDVQIAQGHMLEMKLEDTPEDQRCPRWKALRIYVTEWARQHPDLDNLDPLAWGVRERRGSWAF